MDDRQFDALVMRLTQTRLSRLQAVRRAAASALICLAGVSLSTDESAAKPQQRRAQHEGNGRKRGNDKKAKKNANLALCHQPGTPAEKTILVAPDAVPGHLRHGDTLGPCGHIITQPPPPAGGCTPLLQVCWPEWLGGNPCCDANADCLYVNADVPAFFCLDDSKTGCTSDADCVKRFSDPNIACLPHYAATCRSGVSRCCQRRTCDPNHQCAQGAVCCASGGSFPDAVCCAAGQICNTITGCVTQ
jgi:hypothetical protein